MSNPRVIVSLDYADESAALNLVNRLDAEHCRLKIGKELFTSCGPALIRKLVKLDFDIFLDLKFHDIPNTVAKACMAAADLGVWMINVHASGGKKMLIAARDALAGKQHPPLLIGVTVLTSLSTEDLHDTGIDSTVEEQVLRLAMLSKECDLDGVVCSAREISILRSNLGDDFKLVTPGIRPAGSPANDQKRIMTPAEAIHCGSDYLVIGRPITRAKDPLRALLDIEEEVNLAIRNSAKLNEI